MAKVEEQRGKIDKIDEEIVALLGKRLSLALKIGNEKKNSNESVYDPAREEEVIARLKNSAKGFPKDGIEKIYREIFSISRRAQQKIKIAYLGPSATFTHFAALAHFGSASDFLPFDSIEHVFRAVEKGEADFGVVPIENSLGGSVTYTYDMFMNSDLNIIAELSEKIEHNLISKYRIKDIEKIYSHQMAILQCGEWIAKNLPSAQIIEVASTSKSAESAKLYINSAGIGSELAARQNGLNIVARSIQDRGNNITRFLVIGKAPAKKPQDAKTSILFTTKNIAAALLGALEPLRENGISMMKIESRPSKIKNWDYVFFVDFKGFVEDEGVQKALEEMKKNTGFLKILGSYPQMSEK